MTAKTLSVAPNGKVAVANRAELAIEVTTVTPELAAHWLARGGKNRKIVQARVDMLTAAIQRGEWHLTGEPITLDADGRVRNGQHRLSAVVKSGLPIQTVVVRNIDEAAFDVMDTGRSRTVGDTLGIHGYPSQNAVAGTVRLLLFTERTGEFKPSNNAERYISAPTTLAYLEQHDDVINGVRMGDRVRRAGLRGGVAVWGYLFTLFLRIDAESAYQFAHYLSTGEDMTAGHPVLLLRNRLIYRKSNDSHRRSLEDRELLAALVIKTWNAFRQNKPMQMLVWRNDGPKPEAFPKPL